MEAKNLVCQLNIVTSRGLVKFGTSPPFFSQALRALNFWFFYFKKKEQKKNNPTSNPMMHSKISEPKLT
jgi:hypothetical protein